MVVGILGSNIAVGFTGHQSVLIPVLRICFSVGSKRHHNTVAIYYLNGYILIRKERECFAFTGLDCQGIGVGISACGNHNINFRYSAHRNSNRICQCLTIHSNRVILFQAYGTDRYRSCCIQHLVGVFLHITGKRISRRLIRAVLIQNRNGSQCRDPVKDYGIILGIGIAVIPFMG